LLATEGTLYSGAFESLDEGLAELDRIESELAANPNDLTDLATKHPTQLAMLDAAKAKRAPAEQAKGRSHEEEKRRSDQLRLLVRGYKEAVDSLAMSNAYYLVGDAEKTQSSFKAATEKLAELERLIGLREPPDLFLFEAEPSLGEAPKPDQK
jgi:hypothetical protein